MKKKEDILAECLDDIALGKRTLGQCLAMYPHLHKELRSHLIIAGNIRAGAEEPSDEFITRTRRRLFEVMEATPGRNRAARLARRLSVPAISALTGVIFLAASGATVYASQQSLPDEVLYPVKTGVETLQLAITRAPDDRANLHLKLAQRRLDEVVAQSALNRQLSIGALKDAAQQIDSAIKEMARMSSDEARALAGQLYDSALGQQAKLDTAAIAVAGTAQPALQQAQDASRRAAVIGEMARQNPAVLRYSPSVLDSALDSAQFSLEGALLSIEDGTWNVGGLALANVVAPVNVPAVGSQVKIEGVVLGGEAFIKEAKILDDRGKAKVKGIFGGVSSDGLYWRIGGLNVPTPAEMPPPAMGSDVELESALPEGQHIASTGSWKQQDKAAQPAANDNGNIKGDKDNSPLDGSQGGQDSDPPVSAAPPPGPGNSEARENANAVASHKDKDSDARGGDTTAVPGDVPGDGGSSQKNDDSDDDDDKDKGNGPKDGGPGQKSDDSDDDDDKDKGNGPEDGGPGQKNDKRDERDDNDDKGRGDFKDRVEKEDKEGREKKAEGKTASRDRDDDDDD